MFQQTDHKAYRLRNLVPMEFRSLCHKPAGYIPSDAGRKSLDHDLISQTNLFSENGQCLRSSFFSCWITKTMAPPATAPLVAATSAMPAILGLNKPFCNSFIELKYLRVPYERQPAPEPTNAAEESLKSPCPCCRTGERASKASSLASATPRATNPRPVRVHERKVRSLAR